MRGDIKAVSTAARTVRQQVEDRREEFSSSSSSIRQTKMREREQELTSRRFITSTKTRIIQEVVVP